MKVRLAAAEERDFTKEFADECWRRNPRISPDGWRLTGGLTAAKVWLNGRQEGVEDWVARQAAGVNGVVTELDALPVWREVLVRGVRQQNVLAVVVDEIDAVPEGVDYVLWRGAQAAALAAGLARLERAVADGRLVGYGFWVTRVDELVWSDVEELAKQAATTAWGRRKRPSWNALVVPFSVANRAALTQPVWVTGSETVSLLEGASRRDFLCLVTAPPMAVRLDDDVIGAVEELARHEAALIEKLGGWPQRGGQEVFSVLRHVQQGMPLWPGEQVRRYFIEAVLPELRQVWGQVAVESERYLAALAGLVQEAGRNGLSAWGEGQLAGRMLAQVRERIGAPWATLSDEELAAALVTSVPGVSGVVGDWSAAQVRTLMETPSVPDIGRVLV